MVWTFDWHNAFKTWSDKKHENTHWVNNELWISKHELNHVGICFEIQNMYMLPFSVDASTEVVFNHLSPHSFYVLPTVSPIFWKKSLLTLCMVFTYPPPQEFGLKLKEYRCAGCDYKTTVRHGLVCWNWKLILINAMLIFLLISSNSYTHLPQFDLSLVWRWVSNLGRFLTLSTLHMLPQILSPVSFDTVAVKTSIKKWTLIFDEITNEIYLRQ